MDQSTLRRGKKCWYLVTPKSYASVSDSYFLENVIYLIIDHFLINYPININYKIKKMFSNVSLNTAIGQFIDMAKKEPTIENWILTVKNKTAYYSMWLPFIIGIVASQKIPSNIYESKDLKELLILGGILFQLQDDWIDLYGSTAKTGKIGTDIPDGKVSWLFAKAIEISNENQKKILLENIGQNNNEKILKVIEIYKELEIEKLIIQEQDKLYEKLKELFNNCNELIPKGLINFVLNFLNHRNY